MCLKSWSSFVCEHECTDVALRTLTALGRSQRHKWSHFVFPEQFLFQRTYFRAFFYFFSHLANFRKLFAGQLGTLESFNVKVWCHCHGNIRGHTFQVSMTCHLTPLCCLWVFSIVNLIRFINMSFKMLKVHQHILNSGQCGMFFSKHLGCYQSW